MKDLKMNQLYELPPLAERSDVVVEQNESLSKAIQKEYQLFGQ